MGFTDLWSFLQHHLSEYEVERLMSLKNVTTDVGRCRAWLRASLNEKTLAKYVESMIGNEQLLEWVIFFSSFHHSFVNPSVLIGNFMRLGRFFEILTAANPRCHKSLLGSVRSSLHSVSTVIHLTKADSSKNFLMPSWKQEKLHSQ